MLLLYFSLFVTAIYLMAVRVTSPKSRRRHVFVCLFECANLRGGDAVLVQPVFANWARWRCCSISTRSPPLVVLGRLLRRLFVLMKITGVYFLARTALHRVFRSRSCPAPGAEIARLLHTHHGGLRGIRCTELRLSARRSAACPRRAFHDAADGVALYLGGRNGRRAMAPGECVPAWWRVSYGPTPWCGLCGRRFSCALRGRPDRSTTSIAACLCCPRRDWKRGLSTTRLEMDVSVIARAGLLLAGLSRSAWPLNRRGHRSCSSPCWLLRSCTRTRPRVLLCLSDVRNLIPCVVLVGSVCSLRSPDLPID